MQSIGTQAVNRKKLNNLKADLESLAGFDQVDLELVEEDANLESTAGT